MIKRDWYGLYGNGWKSGAELTSEAFGHPAKFSRSLIRRIYEHCLEQGYLSLGDIVLDPFGGVALGGIDAVQNDLRWIGVELEQPFNDMGAGCDCTGISKADWVRFYGRWDRARYQGERYWCPRCLAEAKRISAPDNGQLSFLDKPLSASYVRNSGQIPHTEPHHYTGNTELWGNGSATLLQGDSRFLCDVLSEAGGVISSPPYAQSNPNCNSKGVDVEKQWKTYRGQGGGMSLDGFRQLQEKHSQGYGSGSANLANLPQGDWQAVVSSPPYADGCRHTGGDDPNPEHVQGGKLYGVGIAGAISSPPYAESLASDDPGK